MSNVSFEERISQKCSRACDVVSEERGLEKQCRSEDEKHVLARFTFRTTYASTAGENLEFERERRVRGRLLESQPL